MTATDPRLLTPPKEEEEVYPYRRAWRSVVYESAVLFALAAVLYVLVRLFGLAFPERLRLPVNALLALAPASLWLAFSWQRERFVPEPRRHLLMVLIVSALAANAVGVPLVNDFLQVERWLPLSETATRIAGYSFTVGIVQEFLKYLVIRYLVWPGQFRTRQDGIAYAAAGAIGYATVLNLHDISAGGAPDATAIRVFGTVALHIATSIIVSYGLTEIRFTNASPLVLPASVALAALVTGIGITFRAGLVNADFTTLAATAPRPIMGLIFSAGVFAGVAATLAYLFDIAEQRAREAAAQEA